MGSSMVLAASRQTFAFSRDGALPFSGLLYRINKRTKTPVNTVRYLYSALRLCSPLFCRYGLFASGLLSLGSLRSLALQLSMPSSLLGLPLFILPIAFPSVLVSSGATNSSRDLLHWDLSAA